MEKGSQSALNGKKKILHYSEFPNFSQSYLPLPKMHGKKPIMNIKVINNKKFERSLSVNKFAATGGRIISESQNTSYLASGKGKRIARSTSIQQYNSIR